MTGKGFGRRQDKDIIGENDLAATVQVYPNPATKELNINLTTHQAWLGLEATLNSAEGKVAKNLTITSPTTQLDVSDLQTGIYLLKIASENQIVIKRLVIQ